MTAPFRPTLTVTDRMRVMGHDGEWTWSARTCPKCMGPVATDGKGTYWCGNTWHGEDK